MREYKVTYTGVQPILMHQDNPDWDDTLKSWRAIPENKKKSTAGDDRSPAWTWWGKLYNDMADPGSDGIVGIPSDVIMSNLKAGGVLVMTGKGQKTFKAQTQSGVTTPDPYWPLTIDGKTVPVQDIWTELIAAQESDFAKHQEVCSEYGFELFVKRAKIGMAKHVRVRPMFRTWACSGRMYVVDEMITTEVLTTICTQAGLFKGLGDWRPGAPSSPGCYGTFTVEVEEV